MPFERKMFLKKRSLPSHCRAKKPTKLIDNYIEITENDFKVGITNTLPTAG